MKYTIVAFSLLCSLVSGLAVLELPASGPRFFRPEITIVITEDHPSDHSSCPPAYAEVSRSSGSHNVKTLLGFSLPAFSMNKKCTVKLSKTSTASGSKRLQFFTTIGYPACGNTWNHKPSTDNHKGTFLANAGSSGTVVEDFGLTFPCPSVPTKYGFEVQPAYDNVYVTWEVGNGGFIISVSN